MPSPIALLIVFLLGLVAGGVINWGIYRLAYNPRPIGPWSPAPQDAPPRRWIDFFPFFGWWGLRREATIHGSGYWVRPLLIELGFALGAAWLYWWEMTLALYPAVPGLPPPGAAALHLQFFSHLLLIAFMTVATFIDFDEQMIPDAVTIPGALIGLILAILAPAHRLPEVIGPAPAIRSLHAGSPGAWPAWLDGAQGLALGLAIFAAWCLALLPGLWTLRRGWRKAVAWWLASLMRHGQAKMLLALIPIGWAVIAGVWLAGGTRWESLLTSLAGMAFGGGLVWAVRIIAGSALRQEAMGFGDVTLLAMIGVYLGWQSTLMIFFMAPFFGVLVAVAQVLITGRRDIAYGPYLCLAATYLIVDWSRIWDRAAPIFLLGELLLMILAFGLVMMGALLLVMQIIKRLLGLAPEEPHEVKPREGRTD